jgi:hypothetical protein
MVFSRYLSMTIFIPAGKNPALRKTWAEYWGMSPVPPRLPILAEVRITGPQCHPIAVICTRRRNYR